MTDTPPNTRPPEGLAGQPPDATTARLPVPDFPVPGEDTGMRDGAGNQPAADVKTAAGPAPDIQPAAAMKPFFKSKTLFANALLVAAALYPPTAALITAEPTTTVVAAGILNLLLRAITKEKVTLFPDSAE